MVANLFLWQLYGSSSTDFVFFRYKVLQWAKRKQDGLLPTQGFSTLKCQDSVRAYARTLARCLFFLVRDSSLEPHSSALARYMETNVAPDAFWRTGAVDCLLFEALCQAPARQGFALETFVELYYVVAPSGSMNRSADSVHHVAAQLLYAMRGAYILRCATNFDPKSHEDWSKKFLDENQDNALSAVQSIKRLAAYNIEDMDCKILWLDEGRKELQVETERGNVIVSVSGLRGMYNDLLRRCATVLQDMGIPLLTQDLLDTAVDVTTKTPGESIMSMNAMVFAAIMEAPTVSEHASSSKSNRDKEQFCQRAYELGKLLVLALYLSGGPSARLTEIGNWLIANTFDTTMRNVRFLRKAVAVINTYSKAESMGSSEGNIACFADIELSALVMTYLVVVKRIESFHSEVHGQPAVHNSRLYFLVNKGKQVSAVTLGKIFRHEFLSQGIDLSISDMRQVLEAFARKEGCLLAAQLGPNPLLVYANHSAGMSNARYGKSKNDDLPEIAADRMQQCFQYSEHWNRSILGTETTRPPVHLSPSIAPASLPVTLDVHPSMSTVSTSVAVPVAPVVVVQTQQPMEQSSQQRTQSALKRHRQMSLDDAWGLLGIQGFKRDQGEAWAHLQQNKDKHSLIVLPTGSGKSTIVALDALLRSVCNILFVPYVSIGQDVLGNNNPNLNVVAWANIRHDFNAVATQAHIVVASFEHAGPGMIAFIQLLGRLGRCGSSFVDEADVLLHQYRAFGQFWSLAASCPLVKIRAMTATLRPSDRSNLATMLGVDDQTMSEIRMSSRRDDISLDIRYYTNRIALSLGIQSWVSALFAKSDASARVIIFMMTIQEAEELGAVLEALCPGQVSVSHSKRRDRLGRIAIATSCFGHGINIPGLSHVVVVRSSWSVEGFAQVGWGAGLIPQQTHILQFESLLY